MATCTDAIARTVICLHATGGPRHRARPPVRSGYSSDARQTSNDSGSAAMKVVISSGVPMSTRHHVVCGGNARPIRKPFARIDACTPRTTAGIAPGCALATPKSLTRLWPRHFGDTTLVHRGTDRLAVAREPRERRPCRDDLSPSRTGRERRGTPRCSGVGLHRQQRGVVRGGTWCDDAPCAAWRALEAATEPTRSSRRRDRSR